MNKRISSLIGATLFGIISLAGYFVVGNLVSSQSQQHQQSVSPIFGLIESELVEPLHIATTLDKVGAYSEYFTQQEPDQETLVAQLKDYSERFDLEFYVAHEKSRKQFNSDGRVFDLIDGKVIWYFTLKDETDNPIQAVLGKREDVHLYIDIRQLDEQGEFIGFVGVGKSLDDFIGSFKKFKSQYGHEFIFVNNREEIVLSSRQDLLPKSTQKTSDDIGIKKVSSLPWFENFASQTKGLVEPSLVVPSGDGDLLISQFRIESLNWSIYLLTPLSARQQEVGKSFALYIGVGMLILFVLYRLIYHAFYYYLDTMSKKFNFDPLTKLANRRYAQLFFKRKRKKHRATAVLMIDLDHFKRINDNYGHKAGDLMLQAIADLLSHLVRKNDLVVRWGGEEFVIIMPDTNLAQATAMAHKCRETIEQAKVNISNKTLSTTASIGVAYSRNLNDTLSLMVEWADKVMYQAKHKGKNQVQVKPAS